VGAHLFEFALLFGVLGLAATVSIWLRMPVVPLYIVAGIGIGTWVERSEVAEFMGQLGVVFLLFSMGLEFSIGTARREPMRFVIPGAIDLVISGATGLALGIWLGDTWLDATFIAGIVYMTSSAVVSQCIAEFGRAARPETETILSILVFEDLVIAVYLVAIGSFVGSDAGRSGWLTLGLVALFLLALLLLAQRIQHPIERLVASGSEEGFTLALFAFVLLVASAALGAGLSAEVGAFLGGLVIGATKRKAHTAERLIPYRTLFAALFFISFGMSIEVGSFWDVALPGLALIVAGIVSKAAAGYLAGRAAGHPPRPSVALGISLIPKGEFSIVIAALAAETTGSTEIVALTGLYVLALSLLGPVAMRDSDRIAGWLARAPR
jgi:monovalent cation:H+ antiporter-2, CPA2 family